MSQKWCSGCRQERSLFEFGKNRTTKDGLQKWCRRCMREHMAVRRSNGSKLSAKQIKDSLKVQEFGKALIKHNGVAYKAYKEISNCKTDSSAASSCTAFLKKTNFPSQFTEHLKSPKILNAISRYFEEAMQDGTRTEKRDAVRIITQLNGLWKEDSGRQTEQCNGISQEERTERIREVWELVTTGKKMVRDNGGYFKVLPEMP